jgi:hypothetical protein
MKNSSGLTVGRAAAGEMFRANLQSLLVLKFFRRLTQENGSPGPEMLPSTKQ